MRYEFTFTDQVPDDVVAEFPHLTRTSSSTTLFGRVEDAAQLHGLLTRFRLLGLDMTDMHRLPD
ncbi:hypothetical protein GCM10023201_14890 [Actinomycetospora corticicola]|uniref:Uncharacterized protein n=1 Tax=Actinomycetospora corticicola TaxID=663602 RepID=A0A7Y9DVB1_9PSEU|nr:hypothetical protein [Actinomycetospora corticicola]NYD36151.1 hypothetical protein [Actinomycetospora corticicola]